jgi:DNA-directed RNA polymerase specialized sigma24 family protein
MKKKATKIKRELERANAEIESPKNVDFIEISMPNEELDKVAHKYHQLLEQRNDPVLRKKTVRRQEKLLRKIFKTASQVLTDIQMQIFTQCYVYQIPDKEVAQQLNCHPTYVTGVLRACIKKIQKRLRVKVSLKEFSKGRRVKNDGE